MNRFNSTTLLAISWLAATALHGQETDSGWHYEISASHAGETDLFLGDLPTGEISSTYLEVKISQPTGPRDKGLAMGAFASSWMFRPDDFTPVPEELYELGLQFSYSADFNQDWSWRVSISPGLYSDFKDIDFKDFNAPASFAVSYRWTPDLTLVGAAMVDLRAKYPVFGGLGLRWRMTEEWTLNLIFPRPGLEYRVSENLTLFGGVSLTGGSYNLADDFGSKYGDTRLNNDFIDYREIRAGLSATWRWDDATKFTIGGGALLDRRFEYDATSQQMISDDTYYLEASLQSAF